MKNETKVSFNCPNDVLFRIDSLSKKAGSDRSKLIVSMLDETSKTIELCGKVGFLQFSLIVHSMSQSMRKWASSMRDKSLDLF